MDQSDSRRNEREVQRERLSQSMGDYLCRGYTLLNETCPQCSNPMMRKGQEKAFCLLCPAETEPIPQQVVHEQVPRESNNPDYEAKLDQALKFCFSQMDRLSESLRLHNVYDDEIEMRASSALNKILYNIKLIQEIRASLK